MKGRRGQEGNLRPSPPNPPASPRRLHGDWGAWSTLGSGCRMGTAEVRVPLSLPLVPESGSLGDPMLPQSQGLPHPRIPPGEIQGTPEPLSTKPQTVQGQGSWGLQQALGSLPEQRDSRAACVVPTRQSGIRHRRPPLPSHPPLVTHPIPLLCKMGVCLHPLKSDILPYSQKTGPQERGNPGWRVEEQERKDTQTWKTDTHTHTRTTVHTQLTQTHRPSPVPEAWEDRFRIRVVFLQALALFYLAIEGVEMLCVPFSRQQECVGAEQPDLTFGVWHYPHPWPACSLWHLQANVHLPVF